MLAYLAMKPSDGSRLLLCDCERVLVTPGGAARTSDGDARLAGVVSTAGR